ncbi:MAG: adenylosuccinate lyase [Chlorobi bacterium]|nr:adenylosuccinate lyase [Chlorobiota bacterium]MCI0716839.1 adenylosuccinate lyase [Chlorobiota bacterium]
MIERYTLPEIAEIWSEQNKFSIWLKIELYAAEANNKLGIVPTAAIRKIKSRAKFNIQKINQIENVVKHDVIAFLTNVASYVGTDSRFIHYGMTSSDVLDTALSIQMKEAGELILKQLLKLKTSLAIKAKKYKFLAMVGRTHGVHAEAITLGLKFAVWYDEINRDISRLETAIKNASVGKISGAVGTYEHINPFVERYVCKKLGLSPAKSSTQIIQRDVHAEYLTTLAIIASSLEKFATEIRHLQKTEVLELEEPFTKGQKGSSAMPHKKNPVICERIAGLARVLRGNSLAAMENINLWHERDISHSSVERMILPDSTMLLYYMLVKMSEVINGLVVNKQNIAHNLNKTHGLIYSQRALLKLVECGLTREQAYKVVQSSAMKSWKTGEDFKSLLLKDRLVSSKVRKIEIDGIFDGKKVIKNINYIFKNVGLR